MIDTDRRTITIDGQVIRPARLGFDLCAYLAAHPGFVRSREQIMDALGISLNADDRTADSMVKRLRKIGVAQIKTSYGVGYYWEA